jgi:release factor glutamine methyltransferase
MNRARGESTAVVATVAELLASADLPPREAQILFGHAAGLSRIELITRDQTVPAESVVAAFRHLAARRRSGEPIAYLVGYREFYGHRFGVTPAVLIPRPETEHLVDEALKVLARLVRPSVLDLGTGSGAIALALALARPDARVTAADRSRVALAVARENGATLKGSVNWVESDWYEALRGTRYDLIVSNPPYVAVNDRHLLEGDLRFEPREALTDGSDGHGALGRIIRGARAHLEPGGWLLLEHGFDQASAVRQTLAEAGFDGVTTRKDLAGLDRVSGGFCGPCPGGL